MGIIVNAQKLSPVSSRLLNKQISPHSSDLWNGYKSLHRIMHLCSIKMYLGGKITLN